MKKLLIFSVLTSALQAGAALSAATTAKSFRCARYTDFPNEPQMVAGRFTWDILRLYAESKNAIRAAAGGELRSIGIDTWGVDYGLLDAHGRLIGNPVHYRDRRTEGIISEFGERVMLNEKLYGITGIQLLDFNTVYQLYADRRDGTAAGAARMLFIPDLLGYFLTGNMACEYTVASTGALLDAKKRDFSAEILSALGLERDFFAPLVHPGTSLGNVRGDVGAEVGGCGAEVVSIASHDTASAVLAVPAKKDEKFVYISSGTWSLLGTETDEPVITPETLALNFTNEGGVGRKIRFLKNIMGLWLLQESRRQWRREGRGEDEIGFDVLSSLPQPRPPAVR
ncbi:MAG: FGGY family carbohydrate kinase [Eubacteriales bacterium]